MSREIKFRVWDDTDKVYKISETSEMSFRLSAISKIVLWLKNLKHKFIVEQYTGLKDKNGKEIYEGGIIKMPSELCIYPYKPIGVVEFGYGRFYVKDEQYEDGSKHVVDFYDYNDPTLDFEVIGNIHENPELLEV